MSKLKKRLAALGVGLAVMATSVMSLSASAVSPVDWPGPYTPYVGAFFVSSFNTPNGEGYLSVSNLRWNSDQTNVFNPPLNPTSEQNGVEFEFRPQANKTLRPNGTHDIWLAKTDEQSTLPLAYFEFQDDDFDDVAICCGDLKYVIAENTYYGRMYMTKQPNVNVAELPYTFESEYGTWAGIASVVVQDYLPLFAATYQDGENNVRFGHNYGWST